MTKSDTAGYHKTVVSQISKSLQAKFLPCFLARHFCAGDLLIFNNTYPTSFSECLHLINCLMFGSFQT